MRDTHACAEKVDYVGNIIPPPFQPPDALRKRGRQAAEEEEEEEEEEDAPFPARPDEIEREKC